MRRRTGRARGQERDASRRVTSRHVPWLSSRMRLTLPRAWRPGTLRMSTPTSKRQRSPSADDFDEFDTSAEDLIRAVQESETPKKARVMQQPKSESSLPTEASSQPSTESVSQPASQPSSQPSSQPYSQPTRSQPSSSASPSTKVPTYTYPYSGTKEDPLLLERMTMNKEWFQRLEPAMRQESFKKLKAFLDSEKSAGKTIYPPPHLIHSWSRTTPLKQVKVVIVGQDPYHQPGQACGHSFSVPMGKAIPASLQNIYKELKAEFPNDFVPPRHGYVRGVTISCHRLRFHTHTHASCLEGWARQGVLLLNACLVCQIYLPL